MNFDTVQQFLRIVLFAIGGWFLGDGIVESSAFESAVGGFISIVALGWWMYWDSGHEHIDKS